MAGVLRLSCFFLERQPLRNCNCLLIKRYRFKKKWAVNTPQKTPSELALEHFDIFHRPVYQKLWPSIRVSLLSMPKYCALVNNFAGPDEIISKLSERGTVDIMHQANLKHVKVTMTQKLNEHQKHVENLVSRVKPKVESINEKEKSPMPGSSDESGREELDLNDMEEVRLSTVQPKHVSAQLQARSKGKITARDSVYGQDIETGISSDRDIAMDNLLPPSTLTSDLNQFVPVSRVLSETEELRQEEVQSSVYTPQPLPLPVLPPDHTPLRLPPNLRIHAFPRGNVSSFPSPKPNSTRRLGYYLLDAASLLPVIALDLDTDCTVLDLCAAPGGKSLAMLQTLLPSHVTCNDISKSRMQRLRETMKWYGCLDQEHLTMTVRDGVNFNQPLFDRVLVDVPCLSDRHSLLEDNNNLFKPGRIKERLAMPQKQRDLLIAGIRSCKPGGMVVYSTCTLAPSQNDGVVQMVVEELLRSGDSMELAVQDLSAMATAFSQTFSFFQTRFGHLVLPSLTANFGPMYICKILRVK